MQKTALGVMVVVVSSALMAALSGCETSHKSHHGGLSPDALTAVQTAFPSAKIKAVNAETEDGVKVYDVTLVTKTEAEVMDNGTVLSVSTPVSAKDLPQAVLDAVSKAAPGARIDEAMKEETRADAKTGKLAVPAVSYEIEVVKDGREGDIEVAGDGKVTEPLKWEAQEKGKSEKAEREKGEHAD
jgi:uncharacterized membrane protein YkoI